MYGFYDKFWFDILIGSEFNCDNTFMNQMGIACIRNGVPIVGSH